MWKTRITELLGIDYPIIQGAMAYISESQLAASIYHAGGAGVIASGGFTVDEVQNYIHEVRDMCGSRAVFGVNLMLQAPNKDDIAQLVCDEKVPFVTIGAGNASPYIAPLHQAGVRALAIVPTVKLAQRVQERGADAIIIEGMEAGGHDGKLTLMALMENVIPSVEVPVITAGGIVDGRGIAAALIMGASGVQRYIRRIRKPSSMPVTRIPPLPVFRKTTVSVVCAMHSPDVTWKLNTAALPSMNCALSPTAPPDGLFRKATFMKAMCWPACPLPI